MQWTAKEKLHIAKALVLLLVTKNSFLTKL